MGSLYTVEAKLKDNVSSGLNNITNELKNQSKQTAKATQNLKQFQGTISGAASSLQGLASSLKAGDFGSFAVGLTNAGGAIKNLGPLLAGLKTSVMQLGAEVTAATGGLNLLLAGAAAVGVAAVKSNIDLQKSQAGLQALLGVSKEVADEYTKDSIRMAEGTARSSAEILDAFTLIGSQAPQLLGDKEALESVTKAAMTLATASDMELVDAAKAVTSALNQMDISASESSNIIDVMAIASQKGAADIKYQTDALLKSGAAAKLAKMSFAELISSIEGIAPSFASSEEAGTKLRATLVRLESQADGKFKPSVVGLNKALENLAAANLTADQMVKMFGQGNLVAASSLIRNRDKVAEMTEALKQNGVANEQAGIKAGTTGAKFKIMLNTIKNLFEELGQSEAVQLLVEGLNVTINVIGKLVKVVNELMRPFMNVLNWILKIEVALVGKLVVAVRTFIDNGIKKLITWWNMLINKFADNKLVQNIKSKLLAARQIVLNIISNVKKLWNDFLKWLGLDTKEVKVDGKVVMDKVEDNSEIVDIKDGTGDKDKVKTVKQKVEVEYKSGSLTDLEKKLTDLQNKYKAGLINIAPEDYKKQVADLQKQIIDEKIRLGLEIDEKTAISSLKQVQSDIKSIQSVISVQVSEEGLSELNNRLSELEDKKHYLLVSLGLDTEKVDNSLKSVQDRLNNARNLLNVIDPEDVELVTLLNDKIQELTSKETEIKIKLKLESEAAEGSLKSVQKKITDLQNKLVTVNIDDQGEIDRITNEIKVLQKQEVAIKVKIGQIELPAAGSLKDIQDKINIKQAELEVVAHRSPEYYRLIEEINQLKDLELKLSIELDSDSLTDYEKKMKYIKQTRDDWDAASRTVNSFGNALKSLGEIVGDETASVLQGCGQVAAAISELIPNVLALVGAKEGEAMATGVAEASKIGFPQNLAAIATTVSSLLAVFASISSVVGGFAEGGIITGASHYGDQMYARVNAGEMILNGRQQQRLWDVFNDKNRVNSGVAGFEVQSIRVKGSDLYLALSNYSKVKSKVGISTGIL